MESRWRQNIPDLMMSHSDWRLAARSLEEPLLLLVSRMGDGIQESSVWDIADPDQLPVQVFPWTPRAGNFPFGEEVEPD